MLSLDDVRRVAHLAHLHLTEEHLERLRGQLNDILGYMDKLNQLNTDDIPPTAHAVQLSTAFREDVVSAPVGQAAALTNAPHHDDEHFRVPAVIE